MMYQDSTGKYAESIKELKHVLGDLGKEKSLPEFELIIQRLVKKGYIKFVKGKGYTLSRHGVKQVEQVRGITN